MGGSDTENKIFRTASPDRVTGGGTLNNLIDQIMMDSAPLVIFQTKDGQRNITGSFSEKNKNYRVSRPSSTQVPYDQPENVLRGHPIQ